MKYSLSIGTPLLLATFGFTSYSQAQQGRDLYADTWVAVDDLGRSVSVAPRAPQTGKTAAIFYYIANSSSQHLDLKSDNVSHQNPNLLIDISKLLAANPQKLVYGPQNHAHWWGEPLFGYYLNDDPWVIRRHLSMLSDAGIDTLFFDVTNSVTYRSAYMAICKTSLQMRREGNKTPQIAFVCNARTAETATKLYQEFYKPNRYNELWFKWQGKPLIIADVNATYGKDATDPTLSHFDDEYLPSPKGDWKQGDALPDEIKSFFTWRQSWAWSNPGGWFGNGKGKWPWLDNSPQQPGLSESGAVEQIVVNSAQHPTTNIGKSYRAGKQPANNEFYLTPDTNKGIYFAEQWKRALEVDPPLVWVTQWNEWTAGHSKAGADGSYAGRPQKKGDGSFVDVFNAEYTRDIEPMRGGWGDNYYLQLVDNLRRFKGARPIAVDTTQKTISNWTDWDGVKNEYRDTAGDNATRDWPGWGGARYRNNSGRNDIVSAKVATDAKNISFYMQTSEPLTSWREPRWMNILVDSDQNSKTGWNGYDFCVNSAPLSETETAISIWSGDGWRRAGRAKFSVQDNRLQVVVPRALLRQNQKVAFDFHCVDNAPLSGDIKDFWFQGDSAPNGRFNYRYQNAA